MKFFEALYIVLLLNTLHQPINDKLSLRALAISTSASAIEITAKAAINHARIAKTNDP